MAPLNISNSDSLESTHLFPWLLLIVTLFIVSDQTWSTRQMSNKRHDDTYHGKKMGCCKNRIARRIAVNRSDLWVAWSGGGLFLLCWVCELSLVFLLSQMN